MYSLLDGRRISLDFSRFDERQRRLRLSLPKICSCWDYAPLIDVICQEPGFDTWRFTGMTAKHWLTDLLNRHDIDYYRFKKCFELFVNESLYQLNRYPRIPDNHYCIQLATPPFESSLVQVISQLTLQRASVDQWLATLRSLNGIKTEEIKESGVLIRLQKLPKDIKPTKAQVLEMVNFAHVIPKFTCESRFDFVATAGWKEVCQRIPEKEFKRHRLPGKGYGAWHIIRYRHKSLNWSIVRSRYRDLLYEHIDWWGVLNEKGHFIHQSIFSFISPEEAMEYAEFKMSQHFASWGKDQILSKWEQYSLPGGNSYREILIQLDDWFGTYKPRHYRTRNVLAHVRTSIRTDQDGRQILFLDEVQSDWHADLYQELKFGFQKYQNYPLPDAPFRKEWPLLSMKLMIWWARLLGVEGVAWSTVELQLNRWGKYGPPVSLYQAILPDAARAMSKTLNLPLESTKLSVRTNSRRVELGKHGWEVHYDHGIPLTKPFRTRAQAERYADLTGDFVVVDVPVLWIKGLPRIHAIPLYGAGTAQMWLEPNMKTIRNKQ